MADVVRRWLEPPFDLDGWRIDVANMTGRYRDIDVNHEVARVRARARAAARRAPRRRARPRLPRGPRAGRLARRDELRRLPAPGLELAARRRAPGRAPSTRSRRSGRRAAPRRRGRGRDDARVPRRRPWQSALHSWTLLDSHDTPRFRTVARSREPTLVGDRAADDDARRPDALRRRRARARGRWGEDARRTMPWDRPETLGRDAARRVPAADRAAPLVAALARGGIRYAPVGDDAIAYLRETRRGAPPLPRARAPHEPVRLPLASSARRARDRCTAGTPSSTAET